MLLQGENITNLLREARDGRTESANRLMDAVYADLRIVARRFMASERQGHTLQPTAVVHEAFLRLFRQNGGDAPPIAVQDRAHFLAVAARQMRRILIDHARLKRTDKRHVVTLSLDDAVAHAAPADPDVETLDALLLALAGRDPDAANVVELKFFGGLTDNEAALAMNCSLAKVRRDWEFARSWLRHQWSRRNSG